MKKLFLPFWILTSIFVSCSSVNIIDKPINFDKERSKMTLEYLDTHYGIKESEPVIKPKMVVVHWTAIPTFEKSYEAFYSSYLPGNRTKIKSGGDLNVSAHFLVDRDGTIYRLLPETMMARHVIGLNHCAIGIENVGGTPDTPLTKAQLKANINLIKYLKKKYPGIEYVIGHYEYTNFENHPLWKEKDPNYRTEKTDPGEDFINKIREATKKYHWKPVPQKS